MLVVGVVTTHWRVVEESQPRINNSSPIRLIEEGGAFEEKFPVTCNASFYCPLDKIFYITLNNAYIIAALTAGVSVARKWKKNDFESISSNLIGGKWSCRVDD